MTEQPEALLVATAAWVGAAALGYLACAFVRARRAGCVLAATVIAVGATVGGVASADTSHRRAPAGLSLDWSAAARRASHPRGVVVRPGDCLWAMTARELRDPTPARVATRWPRWWHANRNVIGPNPNLIHPGQRLRRPEPSPRRR